jgi:uncharacterized protein YbjT (DUF2867 family)
MSWDSENLYCQDLPTTPRPEVGKILVTGATGYVGGRLVPELLARGYKVRLMVRRYSPEQRERWPGAELIEADALNVAQLKKAMQGIDVAYYLIHSMLLGRREFEQADIQTVTNFRFVAEEQKLKRIIYLGGLGQYTENLSNHLRSRLNVAEILKKSRIPTTILKAAIIIGSGSASFEIIKNIVKNCPVYFFPSWSYTLCQPVSIRDIVKYLVGVLETDGTENKSFDLCGEDILSYREMILTFSRLLRKRRLYIRSPISNITFYSYLVLARKRLNN